MIKVAMIGAGSVVFSRNLTGDILSYPEFKDATLCYMDVDAERWPLILKPTPRSDAVVFGSNIAYLQQVRAGQVVQLNVTPVFPADMQLTVVSLAGRSISPTAPLVAAIIREQVAA